MGAAARQTLNPTSFEVTCQPGLVYGRAGDEELLLDLYLPSGAPLPALVVYLHGGGWVSGSREGPSAVASAIELAHEGFAVASVDYRLGPKYPAPAAIEDSKLAVRWLRANAGMLRVDGERILAMGYSAGGHLALMLGLTRPEDGLEGPGLETVSSHVEAVINLCGVTNIEGLLAERGNYDWAEAWIPSARKDRMELARQCSPVQYVRADAPPVILIHGEADPNVPPSQAQQLHAALQAVGARSELAMIPAAGHFLGVTGSARIQRHVREARRSFLSALGFLRVS